MSPADAMGHALSLAQRAKGRTSPNPAVGAVLVRDGRVVGEGATQPGGRPHAEAVALATAGPMARGAALYVTLEPCAHHGRTPPCADAVVAAGVAEAHIATLDPNPLVAGRGAERIRAGGIAVRVGERAADSRALNEDFARWITTGRPHVTAKFAASLDGRIATRTGESRWITGREARTEVHHLRDVVDAIMVGVGTVLMDDPQLTTRIERPARRVSHPWRIVVDSHARTPPTARVCDPALPGRTTVAVAESAPAQRRAALEERGVEVLAVTADAAGRIDLGALLDALGRRGATSLLVEGGATLLGALFDGGHVDRVLAFIAPLIIGGREAPAAVAGTGPEGLGGAVRLMDPGVRRFGVDTLVSGDVRRVAWPEWQE